jgi:hypothetical protein
MKPLHWILIAIISFILAACEGDAGQHGVDLMGSDHIAPVVEIILPMTHRLIYNESALEVRVQDDGEVDRVEILVDGEHFEGQDLQFTSLPYQMMWDCSSLEIGQHFVQAIAYDKFGRIGYSPRVSFYKVSPDSVPPNEIIAYYNEPKYSGTGVNIVISDDAIFWRIPSETGQYTGFGTRFTLDRPARLVQLWINLQYRQKVSGEDVWWETFGTQLKVEIFSAENGLPTEILSERELDLSTFAFPPPLSGWVELNLPLGSRRKGSLSVPSEFIVAISLSPTATGDTIAVATDLGARRNWHGMVRENGEWRTFDAGPRVAFNPLIRVELRYPKLDN